MPQWQYSYDVLTPLFHTRYYEGECFPQEVLRVCTSFLTTFGIIGTQIKRYEWHLRRFPHKNWVIFIENPSYHPRWFSLQEKILCAFMEIAKPNAIVLQIPPDQLTYLFFSSKFNVPIFCNFATVPFAYTITPRDVRERERIWFPYAYEGSVAGSKGRDVLDILSKHVPIEIAEWQYGVLSTVQRLGEVIGVPFCSRHDSSSRHWWAALLMKCAIVHLRTQAQFYQCVSLLGRDCSFYDKFIVCENIPTFIEVVKRATDDFDYRCELVSRGQEWLHSSVVQDFCNYHILWERWHDNFGDDFMLGADLTLFHHFPENYWTPAIFFGDYFPDGEWKRRPVPITIQEG